MEIKIRYVLKNKTTKEIIFYYLTLSQIEKGEAICISNAFDIISRDLFTGKQDKAGKDIYAGDIGKGIMDYGAGMANKPGKECLFLIKIVVSGWGYEFILEQITKLSNNYRGLPNFEELEIIGNRHQNPELLEEK